MIRGLRLAMPALCGCLLTACLSVGPNFDAPRASVPDKYGDAKTPSTEQTPRDETRVAQTPSGPSAKSFWWQEFHDSELDRMESLATAGNLDLKVAYLRIVESREQVQSARSQGLPSLNASAAYTREQVGLAGILKSQGVPGTAAESPATQSLINSLEQPVNLYQLGFDASWELDLFGKVRRSVEAAKAQSQQAVEARNDLMVTLQAEVAKTYLQFRAGQALQKITQALIADQRDVVELLKNSHAHGLTNEPDVQSAVAQFANLESELPEYDQMVMTARHQLAVLTGQNPEALDAQFNDTRDLPQPPPDLDVGIPSELARRRPDIRSAEAALHVATAQIGVATSSLYPDVALSGTFGLRNLGTRYLFDWASKFYTFGPQISLPIFHGGALVANVRLSQAQAAEAALSYRKAVLTALQEVEDGLTNLHDDAVRTAALKEAVGANRRALEVDMDAYRRGLVTYIAVLTVQLQSNQAQQQLAQAMLTQSTDLVKLYKALGGGWDDPPGLEAPGEANNLPAPATPNAAQ